MIKKCMLAAAVLSLMMVWTTGCGSEQETGSSGTALVTEDQSAGGQAEDEAASQPGQDGDEENRDGTTNVETESVEPLNSETGNDESGNIGTEGRELIFIGGKVRSVSQSSFVISRTLMEEADDGRSGCVVMPEAGSPEEELVTVRCMDSTAFERWIIQGVGADIVMEEAAFSEIQEGTGLEAQGYFDGEEFVAEKVIIEIYE